MTNEADLRGFVKIMCAKEISEKAEIERHFSTLTSLMTEDFRDGFNYLIDLRQHLISVKWRNYFDTNYKKMFESHELYLSYLMFACIKEHEYHRNIFDSFLSVSMLVISLNNETYDKTKVDFSGLNHDIIMILFQNEMKRAFNKHGGFKGLAKHVYGHPYRIQNHNNIDFGCESISNLKKSSKKFIKEYSDANEKSENPYEVLIDERITKLAKNVLSTSSVELPTLPTFKKSKKPRKRKKRIKLESELKFGAVDFESLGGLRSIGDSKNTHDMEWQENVEKYENTIQAIIRYNRSKNFGKQDTKNQLQEKADGVVQHVKDTVQSLSKVLDEYVKE